MFETVDLYCERLGPGIWAEPVNALTNLSFIVGAWFAFIYAKRHKAISVDGLVLTGLICAIGIGSGLFHTVANNFTRVLDVLPILIFQLAFIWIYCRKIIGIRPSITLTIVLLLCIAAILGRQMPHILNGSLIYAHAIVSLIVLSIYHMVSHRDERFLLLMALLAFIASFTCRTLDMRLCPSFPLGTHFLWHLINGLVLYLMIRALLSNQSTNAS